MHLFFIIKFSNCIIINKCTLKNGKIMKYAFKITVTKYVIICINKLLTFFCSIVQLISRLAINLKTHKEHTNVTTSEPK